MSRISLRNINKAYVKNELVIKNMSLEIFDNEFLVLVGPSGCGKTTTLRMIAGLEEITSGNLYINNKLQNDETPAGRNLSFVFQNYALLPSLTVYQNIEFGLLDKKLTKLEKKLKVETVAKNLSLYHRLGSFPHQLSGGERQRVALGRSLVDGENLVLFDEPLSNLDAVLRAQMRGELVKNQIKYKMTCLYVTHDQIEAMSMATRIVLLEKGEIIQVGTPDQMYNDPIHLTAATFIGSPEINVIGVKYDGKKINFDNSSFEVNKENKDLLKDYVDDQIYIAIRPQDVVVYNSKKSNLIESKLNLVEHFGYNKLLDLDVDGLTIKAIVDSDFVEDETLYIDLSGKSYFFDNNQYRIKKHLADKIYFNFSKEKSDAENQVIRELENYGYTIINDGKLIDKKTMTIDFKKDKYIVKNNNELTELIKIEELIKILSYRK